MPPTRGTPTAGSSDGRETADGQPEVTSGQHPSLDRVLVVGGGQVGRRIAERLASGAQVHHLDDDERAVQDPRGYDTSWAADVTSPAALAATGADAEHTAVVVTGHDGRNLLVAQHVRSHLSVGHVVVVLSDPRNRPAFDIPDVAVICQGVALADSLTSAVPADLDRIHEPAPSHPR